MAKELIFAPILLAMVLHVNCVPPTDCTDTTAYLATKNANNETTFYVCFDEISKPILKECPASCEFNENTVSCAPKLGDPVGPSPSKCTATGQLLDDPEKNVDEVCNFYNECIGASPAFTLKPGTCESEFSFDSINNKCVPEFEWYCDGEAPDCDIASYKNKRILDKYNCNSFYQCVGNVRVKYSCDLGKVFDPEIGTCSSEKECAVVTPRPSIPKVEDICKGNSQKFIPDPNYCKGYYYCVDEKTPYWSYCSGNLYFNDGFCTKVRPNTCRCEDIDWTDSPSKVFVPHPDKDKFYVCQEGQAPDMRTCPSGTYFNQDVKSCTV